MINVTLKTGEIITVESRADIAEAIDKLNEPDLKQAFDFYCIGEPKEIAALKSELAEAYKESELEEEARFFLSEQVRSFLEKLKTLETSKFTKKRIEQILKESELEGSEYLS